MGATDEEITIDVVVVGYITQPTSEVGTTIENFMTARDIHKYYIGIINDNFVEELMAYPNVNIRYYFQDNNIDCPHISELNFNGVDTWCY